MGPSPLHSFFDFLSLACALFHLALPASSRGSWTCAVMKSHTETTVVQFPGVSAGLAIYGYLHMSMNGLH